MPIYVCMDLDMQASSLLDTTSCVGQGLTRLKQHLDEARASTSAHQHQFVAAMQPVAEAATAALRAASVRLLLLRPPTRCGNADMQAACH